MIILKYSKLKNGVLQNTHSMARVNLNKSEELVTNTTAASKYIPKRSRICINRNSPFQTSHHKFFKNGYSSQHSHLEVLLSFTK